jgi:hypothetical protein
MSDDLALWRRDPRVRAGLTKALAHALVLRLREHDDERRRRSSGRQTPYLTPHCGIRIAPPPSFTEA